MNEDETPIDKLPPHCMGSEMAAIGSCIMESGCTSELISYGIKEEHFYDRRHRTMFVILFEMCTAGITIEPVSFLSEATTTEREEAIGGAGHVSTVMAQVTTTVNLSHWADVLKEKFMARMVIAKCTMLIAMANSRTDSLTGLIERFENDLRPLKLDSSEKPFSMRVSAHAVIEAIEEAGKGNLCGLRSGLFKLDELTGGFRGGELITIAARPSCGKSSLSTTLVKNICVDNNWPTVLFSLEMSRDEVSKRIMASISDINIQSKIRGAQTLDHEYAILTDAELKLGKAPLIIVDKPRISISQLKAQARVFVETLGTRFFIVDYLQIVQASNHRDLRSQQVAEIARGLKELAFDLNVPVLALAQLNRSSDKEERIPRLSDLKESGAIEEASNIVLLLHPVADEKEDENGVLPVNVFVAKSRDGATKGVVLGFKRTVTRFENHNGIFL